MSVPAYIETNNLHELNPVKGERIICDAFGTGAYLDYALLRWTKNYFWARRIEDDKAEVTFKCGFGKHPERRAFWRGEEGVLHYRTIRPEASEKAR